MRPPTPHPGVPKRDRVRNNFIRGTANVRMRWFGHIKCEKKGMYVGY